MSASSISAAVRGLGVLFESGTWIAWTNSDGGWRHFTPPTEEWEQSGGVAVGSYSKSLQFTTEPHRLVRWGYRDYIVRHLNVAEQEHLYAIIDRVYLARERVAAQEMRRAEALEEAKRREKEREWVRELEKLGGQS